MPVIVTSGITTTGLGLQVLNYCASSNVSIAIGGGVPWLYPDMPPAPDIYNTTLPGIIGYFPVDRITPVILAADGDVAVAIGETWQRLPLDLDILARKGCRHALIEARIQHDAISPPTRWYQSTGVYLNCTTKPNAGFTPGTPDGRLDLVQQYGLLELVTDTTHIVRAIREF